MNKILYAFALAGVLGLSSCSDFLDQTSPSEMTAENTYASPYYTNLRVNKLYGGMAQGPYLRTGPVYCMEPEQRLRID